MRITIDEIFISAKGISDFKKLVEGKEFNKTLHSDINKFSVDGLNNMASITGKIDLAEFISPDQEPGSSRILGIFSNKLKNEIPTLKKHFSYV